MADGIRMSELANARLSRRDMLRRIAILGFSAPVIGGLLAACGGSDSNDDDEPTATAGGGGANASATSGSGVENTPSSDGGAVTSPAAGSDEPKRGGTFSLFEAANPPSLDPYQSSSQGQAFWSSYTFSRLFMLESGEGVPAGSLETVPDAAASSEVSDDGITYTITLRDNVFWHPPLDRQMTADDVLFSWNRLAGKLPGGTPSTRLDDIDFVTDVTKVDNLTVTFALEEPYPFFMLRLADPKVLFLMAAEVDTEINAAEQAVGTGPWIMKSYTPDSSADFERHPKWHLGPDLPYFDGGTVNILPEYATQLSQFLGGNLDSVVVNGPDMQRVLDGVKDVQIYERPPFPASLLSFSPNEERWNDERLRRAVSMALDRDGMLDAAYGLQEIEDAGIKVTRYWHNLIPAAYGEYWLDPKGDDIDPASAANFKYDPDAAKKLVDEAGGGFDTELHYAAANSRYGEPYRIMSELVVQYLGQIGITVKAIEEDYNSKFLGEKGTSSGYFDGMMWIPQTRTDPFGYINTQYLTPKHLMYGNFAEGKAELIARAKEIQVMTDPAKLKQAIKDFQNMSSLAMFHVPMQYGAAPTYIAYQPWVGNALTYQTIAQGGASENLPYYWSRR